MAKEPQKVIVQSNRIDASILPPGFSLAYKLSVIQQTTDLKNIADASNSANDLAYQAALKNEEQDIELEDHESRITTSEKKIASIEGRVTTVEKNVGMLSDDVGSIKLRLNSAESAITDMQNNKAAKTEALLKADNLAGLSSASISRNNLGLGDSATKNTGTAAGMVAAGNDSRFGTVDGNTGGTISSPLTIKGKISPTGVGCRNGISGSTSNNVFNINWTTDGRAELWIDTTRVGFLTLS